jgi:hypothetical protein
MRSFILCSALQSSFHFSKEKLGLFEAGAEARGAPEKAKATHNHFVRKSFLNY